MALDVVLTRVVEEHSAVTELLLVGGHAKDVRDEHRRRLTLVTDLGAAIDQGTLTLVYQPGPIIRLF